MEDPNLITAPSGQPDFAGSEAQASLSAGTTIATAEGPVPAGWIRPGDMVVTCDHGLQPVLAIGTVEHSRAKLRANPGLWPIRIAVGALGGNSPDGALVVSPWQRFLLRGPELELMLGLSEALVAARQLLGWAGVECEMPDNGAVFYQLVFQHHELLLADGHWGESFFVEPDALAAIRAQEPSWLPSLREGHRWHARPELKD